jgi:hypothetical protein
MFTSRHQILTLALQFLNFLIVRNDSFCVPIAVRKKLGISWHINLDLKDGTRY